MTPIKLDSTGWTLNILEYGEQSPLANHGAFEIGSDDDNKELWTSATVVRTYGLRSVETACIAYANQQSTRP
jgi:hypothetical protein